jgi:hypothetical protein
MKSLRIIKTVLSLATLVCLCGLAACSSGKAKTSMLEQCNGVWQVRESQEKVEFKLAGENKQIIINGHSYPATVQSVDAGTNLAKLKVKKPDGSDTEWMLQQRWNDNGSQFDIVFFHDGQREILTAKS